jgi:hypothetical protein
MLIGSATVQSVALPDQTRSQLVMMLQSQIAPCWIMPTVEGKPGGPVIIKVLLKRDGSLAKKPTTVGSPRDKASKALAASAVKAVERCAPYDGLQRHQKSYEQWRELRINFAPATH